MCFFLSIFRKWLGRNGFWPCEIHFNQIRLKEFEHKDEWTKKQLIWFYLNFNAILYGFSVLLLFSSSFFFEDKDVLNGFISLHIYIIIQCLWIINWRYRKWRACVADWYNWSRLIHLMNCIVMFDDIEWMLW